MESCLHTKIDKGFSNSGRTARRRNDRSEGLARTPNMFYVYLLKSRKDNNFYTGSTNDLKRRFMEHNFGKVFSTKLRIPFDLVYYEAYKDESDARRREQALKLRGQAMAQLRKRSGGSMQ